MGLYNQALEYCSACLPEGVEGLFVVVCRKDYAHGAIYILIEGRMNEGAIYSYNLSKGGGPLPKYSSVENIAFLKVENGDGYPYCDTFHIHKCYVQNGELVIEYSETNHFHHSSYHERKRSIPLRTLGGF